MRPRRGHALLAWLVATSGVGACAGPEARCGLAACGVEREALLKVTAAQLAAPASGITLWDIRRYPGATVAWRARQGGRDYQCREARDPAAPDQVRFVYCRPAT